MSIRENVYQLKSGVRVCVGRCILIYLLLCAVPLQKVSVKGPRCCDASGRARSEHVVRSLIEIQIFLEKGVRSVLPSSYLCNNSGRSIQTVRSEKGRRLGTSTKTCSACLRLLCIVRRVRGKAIMLSLGRKIILVNKIWAFSHRS